jgi:hypothetical protein
MSTVIVTLATVEADQPAGTAAQGGIVFTLSNGAAPQTIAAAPFTASFADVVPGSYVATCQAVDVNGNPVGALLTSDQFTIAAPVPFQIPSSISVTVS